MPSSPIPAPPPIDAAAGIPSLRTLGAGAQQAAAGNDARWNFASNVSVGIMSTAAQSFGGAKDFRDAPTPITVNSNDTTGTAPTIALNNTGTSDGKSMVEMQILGSPMGHLIGNDALEVGCVDGVTLSAVTGKSIGFRIGTTGVGSVDATKWTIPMEFHVTTTGIRFPDGSLQVVAAGGSQWTQVGTDLNYYPGTPGNVGIGSLTSPTAVLHLFSAGTALTNPFITMEDTTLAGSLIQFSDGTGTAGHFMPTITAKAVGSTAGIARGLQFIAEPGTDNSGNSAFVFIGQKSAAALTASPIFRVFNYTTQMLSQDYQGRVAISADPPTAWLEIKHEARNTTGSPLLTLLDTDAASAFMKIYDVADTASEWQPLIHTKAVATGINKAGLTFWAEPTQDNSNNTTFVFDGRLSGAALTLSPIAEFRNFGTQRSKISHNGEQFWTVKIQAGAEVGIASIGYSGNALGLDFEDTGGNSRTDLRHLAGGGMTFHAHAGNAAPPERMRLDPNGQFGIGVSPGKPLDVKSTVLSQDGIIRLQATGNQAFNGVQWLDESGNTDMYIGIGGSAVTTAGGQSVSTDMRSNNNFVIENNTPFRFWGRATETGGNPLMEQLEILGTTGDWNWYQGMVFFDRSTRNVGIGLADNVAPSEALHVVGNIRVNANDSWLGFDSLQNSIRWSTTTPTGSNAAGYMVLNSKGNMIINFDSDNNAPIGINGAKFGIYNNKDTSTMSGSLLLIQEDGAIGVGTDAPTEKFQVNGIVHSMSGGIKFPDATLQVRAVVFDEVVKRRGDNMEGALLVDVKGHNITDFTRASWRLSESSGTATALDVKGNYPLATITGTPTAVAGKFGNARDFGGSAYVSGAADSTSATKVKAENWTWGAWIKLGNLSADTHGVFNIAENTNTNSLFFVNVKDSDHKIYVGNSDVGNGTGASMPTLSEDVWYHVVVTRASGAWHIWVNGVDTGAVTVGNSTVLVASPTWYIGTNHLGNFIGTIDDVWFEDREYTSAEINAEYLATYHIRTTGDLAVAGKIDITGDLTVGGNTTIGNASGDTLTINGTAISTPNGLNFDANTLVIDAANNRVGIATAAPTEALEVTGNAKVSGAVTATNVWVPSYGSLYENGAGTGITVTTAGTYYQWVSTTVGEEAGAGYVVGSTSSDDLTVGANGAGKYRVTFTVSLSAPTDALVKGALHKNGSLTVARAQTKLDNGTDIIDMTGGGIVTLASTDTIDLRFTSDNNGDVVTVYNVSVIIQRIA